MVLYCVCKVIIGILCCRRMRVEVLDGSQRRKIRHQKWARNTHEDSVDLR